jgi:hypothetical protein
MARHGACARRLRGRSRAVLRHRRRRFRRYPSQYWRHLLPEFDEGPLGGGRRVEAAFSDNWTARVEYLFVDLQNASYTPFGVPTTVSFDGSLIRAGLDYKFR